MRVMVNFWKKGYTKDFGFSLLTIQGIHLLNNGIPLKESF
jgi:hypothetical protein